MQAFWDDTYISPLGPAEWAELAELVSAVEELREFPHR
jgi:hypothetical protein